MRNVTSLIACLLLCGTIAAGMAGEPTDKGASARITFRVVNEDGEPVSGALVSGYFLSPYRPDGLGDSYELLTGRDGATLAKGRTYGMTEGQVTREGHYLSRFKIPYPERRDADGSIIRAPWSATNTVVLKRIRHPVPMYAKALRLSLPVGDQFLGYDFQVGDWVAPHGKGRVTDLEFLQHFQSVGTNTVGSAVRCEGRVDIRGPNSGSGVIVANTDTTTGSELRSLHEAPEDGYQRFVSFTYRRHGRTIETTAKSDQCLYLRTRVTTNLQGRITGAWHGKIYGSVFETFLYLMNPDGTRNVEFNFNRNLFGGNPRERVGQVP